MALGSPPHGGTAPLSEADAAARAGAPVLAGAEGHLERLAALGTMAASIGHEINNPLSAIINNVDFLCAFASSGEVRDVLGEVREAALRIREIVRTLNGMARPSESAALGNVESAIDWALGSTARELLFRARVTRDVAPVSNVALGETRLGQVFVNLLLNAAHAIEPGNAQHNEVSVRVSSPEPAWVLVEVRDTGHGIPKTLHGRVFEPFFTTKPVGRGTGLGLCVCKSIVEAAGGQIELDSLEGFGTTFRVWLPVARDTTLPAPAPPATWSGRTFELLLVDDDPLVTRSLTRLLSPRHQVHAVSGVDAALELLASGARVDAILCDLLMPHKSGVELYAELRTRGSALSERIVFLTGGALTPALSSFLRGFPGRTLHKPCEAREIETILERLCPARSS